jgi:quinol-cytochrome oxidoreductase complex cytochrome b subunit
LIRYANIFAGGNRSYSWALIVMFVGIGIAIYGHWSDRPDSRKGGWDLARVGLILFIIFGTIFEFIFSFIGVSGRHDHLLAHRADRDRCSAVLMACLQAAHPPG